MTKLPHNILVYRESWDEESWDEYNAHETDIAVEWSHILQEYKWPDGTGYSYYCMKCEYWGATLKGTPCNVSTKEYHLQELLK